MLQKSSLNRTIAAVTPFPYPQPSVQTVHRSCISTAAVRCAPYWRPSSSLDDWVERPVRPISLRQLFFFGRILTESRLISSANYARAELPTRIAHRLREMHKLPYVVVTNPHLSLVYDLYYKAFESFRKIPVIRSTEDNQVFCETISENLNEHLAVIPNLMMGVLECGHLVAPTVMDNFANSMLRARISRRVIAEQHLALTESFSASQNPTRSSAQNEFVGEVLLRCNAQDVLRSTGKLAQDLCRNTAGPDALVPVINIRGHTDATFPYVLNHLEYIVGELLRNSIQAVMDQHRGPFPPPPIDVLICEAPQQVIIRISDQGGGIPNDIRPYLWSFNKGPRSQSRLQNLGQVPALAATIGDVQVPGLDNSRMKRHDSSLSTLSTRSPNLRLGMGLPMSRVYAEYWAGGLEVHSLEGHGADAFLWISKLGNQNEQLTSRESIDAV